jgi:carbonic anhydrase
MKIFLATILFFLVSVISCAEEWNYEDKGPDAWPALSSFPACKGTSQSPINIDTTEVVADSNLKPFVFHNYTLALNLNFTNNGHTVVANPGSDIPYITGSDFTEPYYFLQFHMHWGHNIYQGSEHFIDEDKFPLELHLVHKSKSNKIAVLGFIFQINNQTNTTLLEKLFNITGEQNAVNDSQADIIKLSDIIPSADILSSGYYRYMGSFTTPPCTEGVIWTVFKTKISITARLIESSVLENDVQINWRPPQKLNGRTVYVTPGNRGDKLVASFYNWNVFFISLICIAYFQF